MTGRRLVLEADGGSRGNPGPAGYGAVLRDAETGEVLAERAERIGTATNNVAEYRGLLAGLEAALELAPAAVEVRMDSKLVIEQVSGRWKVKHPGLQPLHAEACALIRGLPSVRLTWVPRERNTAADALANRAMDGENVRTDGGAPPRSDAAAVAAPNRLSGWMGAPAPPVTTLLLRHGQTALSVEKRFCGRTDPPLTPIGLEQAAAVAGRWAGRPPAAVVSSPLRRARATAEAVAERCGLPVQTDPDLRETDFGQWEGLTFREVRERWPAELDAWLADPAVPPPGGESFAATNRRVEQARDRIVARHAPGGSTVVLVSHVTPIKLLVATALGAPLSSLYRMHLDLCSMCTVDWFADGPAVVRGLNELPPGPQPPPDPAVR